MKRFVAALAALLLCLPGCGGKRGDISAEQDQALRIQRLEAREASLIQANEELKLEISALKGTIEDLQSREQRLSRMLTRREFQLRQQELQLRDLADMKEQRDEALRRLIQAQERLATLRREMEAQEPKPEP
jgi:TolA-binding protein